VQNYSDFSSYRFSFYLFADLIMTYDSIFCKYTSLFFLRFERWQSVRIYLTR
jgi:hypothetical protein